MSYILDALRKAEAQRSRGSVPGLHTSPLREGPGTGAVEAGGDRRWTTAARAVAGVVGAAALALLAALAGGWRPGVAPGEPGPREPRTIASSAPMPAGAASAPLTVAAPAAMPVLPAAPPTARPEAPSGARPAPEPAPASAFPAQSHSAPAPAAATLQGAGRDAGPNPARSAAQAPAASAPPVAGNTATLVLGGNPPGGPAAAPLPAPSGSAPSATPPEPRFYKVAELPPEIRQQLPSMTVGGAMHSENAASRMLILNGQLYREGEQPAPGLTLERIQLRSAVLVFKGWRYEIAY